MDLQKLLEHCANIANVLLVLLNGLQSSKRLIRAIKIIEKEGKPLQIRNELNQTVTAILLILEEDRTFRSEEIRYPRFPSFDLIKWQSFYWIFSVLNYQLPLVRYWDLAIDPRADIVVFRDDFYAQTFREIEAVEQRLLQDFHLLLSTRDQMARKSTAQLLGRLEELSHNFGQLWRTFSDRFQQLNTAVGNVAQDIRVRMIRRDQAAASNSQQLLSRQQVILQNLYSIKQDFARGSDRDHFDGIGEFKIEIGYSSAFNYIRKVLWFDCQTAIYV